jgi:predicted nucleic acid-binding protein
MQQGLLVDLDSNLALEAAALGLQEKLAFADSIVYAVAKRHDAQLWTQDEHFDGKPNVNFKPKAKPV